MNRPVKGDPSRLADQPSAAVCPALASFRHCGTGSAVQPRQILLSADELTLASIP